MKIYIVEKIYRGSVMGVFSSLEKAKEETQRLPHEYGADFTEEPDSTRAFPKWSFGRIIAEYMITTHEVE